MVCNVLACQINFSEIFRFWFLSFTCKPLKSSFSSVSGHPPRAMSSSSGNGGGGEGSDGGVGSDGGSDGGGGSSYPGTPYDNLGICYGRLGNNLPPASEVVTLLQSLGVGLVRIYDSDATVLEAFANTQIKVLAGVPNEEVLSHLLQSRSWKFALVV